MAESFDAALAEMRRGGGTETGWIGIYTARQWADRLQSAREAEVAERDALISKLQDLAECIAERAKAEALRQQQERLAATVRADRAVGLLREVLTRDGECRCIGISRAAEREYEAGECPHQRARAFLSEQAGERENGDG